MASLINLGAKIDDYVLAKRQDLTTGQTPSVDKVASYSIFSSAEGEDKSRWGVRMALRSTVTGGFWTVSGLSVDPTSDEWEIILTEEEARELAPDVHLSTYRQELKKRKLVNPFNRFLVWCRSKLGLRQPIWFYYPG